MAGSGNSDLSKSLNGLQQAYEESPLTLGQIYRQFQTNSTKLYQWAKQENWTMRRQSKAVMPKNMNTRSSELSTETPLKTLGRIRKISRQYVSELDDELRNSSELDSSKTTPVKSASERERSIRSLRTLLKIIEEIAELETRFKPSRGKSNRKEIDSKQRLDLARRIKVLRQKHK